MVITRGLRGGKMGGYCLIETKFEFWWWKEFCSWMMVMVAQPCECASAQLSRSVAQSCPTLCDPMNCNTSGLPLHHQLPEFTQTHVHWVGDAIQPSHPLSSPSPPAFNLSQHQGLFLWVRSLQQVAKNWSFSFNISPSSEHPDWFPLGGTVWISWQSRGLSRVFSNTTVQKHQFFCAQLFL